MGFYLHSSSFICLFFLLYPFSFMLSRSSHFVQCQCHENEGSALRQFKESFIINKNASLNPLAYPKVASWTFEGKSNDCCSWDGVQCDANSGHVTGLDLSSSCLYGSIDSNSSLFSLVHLQSLNLAYNHFNYSLIPSQVRNLSRLKYLNLTASMFSGQIPIEISQLSHLSALDLCHHDDDLGEHLLELNKPNLNRLIGNLSRLQDLALSGVRVNSIIPTILSNLSSLVSLHLADCELHGEFPTGIFRLPNLRVLNVSYNEFLIGYLPEFIWNTRLERLGLRVTSFTGELPASIGSLSYLTKLDVYDCKLSGSIPSSVGNLKNLKYLWLANNNFSGEIPSSLENLKNLESLWLKNNSFNGEIPSPLGNLKNLKYLGMSYNNFSGKLSSSLGNLKNLKYLWLTNNNFNGSVPSSLGNLTSLITLQLANNTFMGEVPSSIANLKKLSYLRLDYNQLTGPLPFELLNLTQLVFLSLSFNNFEDCIPNSIFHLKNLEVLDLTMNHFNGTIDFDNFVELKNLTYLSLSNNQLSILYNKTNANASLPNFQFLGLSFCNIGKFPDFLRNQNKLEGLELSTNNIHGHVPKWMLNTSKVNLDFIDLSNNFITGFAQQSNILPWIHLAFINLSSNLLQGSLPIPSVSTFQYYVSNNSLTGNVPKMICNLRSLQVLDLSYNNFSGSLPTCLNNFGNSLLVLDLQRNKLSGSIPKSWMSGSQLTIVNLGQNKFQGRLPRSLAKCTMLKALDLSNNQLNDTFPSWLENLSNLEVLILRSNKFNGPIRISKHECLFPNLHIVDISNNNFIGKLPLELFGNWKFVKFETTDLLVYIQVYSTYKVFSKSPAYVMSPYTYSYTMTITIKGQNRFYEKVLELFATIDMSSNRFSGGIPEGIKSLRGCHSLNLSHNMLSGHIPPTLADLVELEALDLSENEFAGKIPYELIQLTFLEFFNVSHNNLKGPIPQGQQFNTFDSSSFEGNQELCGKPLSKVCGNWVALPPPSLLFKENENFKSLSNSVWEIIMIGYAIGLFFGVLIGNIVITRQHDWLLRTFGRKLI